MCSRTEWRGERKASVNLKIEQEKLPNMNNKEGKYAESWKERGKSG